MKIQKTIKIGESSASKKKFTLNAAGKIPSNNPKTSILNIRRKDFNVNLAKQISIAE